LEVQNGALFDGNKVCDRIVQAKKAFKVYGSKGQSLRFGYLAIGLQCSLHADLRRKNGQRMFDIPIRHRNECF